VGGAAEASAGGLTEVNVDQKIGKRKSAASIIAIAYHAINPARRRIRLPGLWIVTPSSVVSKRTLLYLGLAARRLSPPIDKTPAPPIDAALFSAPLCVVAPLRQAFAPRNSIRRLIA
jgi:hypothetical protein